MVVERKTLNKIAGIICAIFITITLISVVLMLSPNVLTKHYGGEYTIDLPQGRKLVPYTVQWEQKSSNIWYLTEPMNETDEPKEYQFHESSNLGILQGTITFKEHK